MLDQSLVIAIASDFDLTENYNQARNALLSLADTVVIEEATGFNPSGHAEDAADAVDAESVAHTTATDSSRPETSQSPMSSATRTERSGSEPDYIPRYNPISDMPEEELASRLRIMFPDVKDFDIKFALRKAAGDFEKACDELELITFLEANDIERPKGIDGFLREDDDEYGRYRKSKDISTIPPRWPGPQAYAHSDGITHTPQVAQNLSRARAAATGFMSTTPWLRVQTPISNKQPSRVALPRSPRDWLSRYLERQPLKHRRASRLQRPAPHRADHRLPSPNTGIQNG